ncbi:hypothetical protein MVEG_00081 [Podila verticillata NRRL 6337]|nr:hypothetical protein MVEG_00081 [Podila verticillata NRRL 6337]
MISNSGAGKSMQLSQLGVTTFPSGNRFRMGFTKDVVILLMLSNDDIINQRFKDTIAADVCQRSQYEIEMAKLEVSNEIWSCSIFAQKKQFNSIVFPTIGMRSDGQQSLFHHTDSASAYDLAKQPRNQNEPSHCANGILEMLRELHLPTDAEKINSEPIDGASEVKQENALVENGKNTNQNNGDSPCSDHPTGPPTLLLLGNAGAGKSTLLAQLGGKFDSGAKFRRGFTKDISEELVKVNGEDVRLIDVPGLFEPSNKETQLNAQKLNEALLLGHSYRICFVLKAGNRGPDDAEMVMMSKISECVRKSDGSKLSFGMIVNQIPSEEVGDMYKELAKDNFRSMFDGLSIPGFTFDINIDSVIMLPFNELELEQNKFRDTLAEEILKHPAVAIELENDISFCNNDLKRYHTALLGTVEEAFSESALMAFTNGFNGVVSGTIQKFNYLMDIFCPLSEVNPDSIYPCEENVE